MLDHPVTHRSKTIGGEEVINGMIYSLLSKWHLYRGVKFHHPVKRYHFERFEYYNQLKRGETPRISREKLYKKEEQTNA